MSRGFQFIVIEGIDGSGTTTQVQCLADRLRAEGKSVVTTREPTTGPVGKLLRQVLEGKLKGDTGAKVEFDWVTLALLFAADRADHAQSLILPTLTRGDHLICDRYDLSSRIYQSVTAPSHDLALTWVCAINAHAPRPDITLVLDVEPGVAESRRLRRGAEPELFEKSELQRRLALAYEDAQHYVPNDRLTHVPGNLPIADVTDCLYAAYCGIRI